MLARLGQPGISRAVHLAVADEEIIARLLDRAQKEGREDDKEDVIRHRINVYNAETHPLLDYYGKQGKVATVNGIGSIRRIGVKPLAIEETVIALVANKSIDYKITRGGWPLKNHHGRLSFKSLPGGRSQLTWRIEFDGALPGSAFLVKQLLGLAISRGLKKIA